MVLKVETNTITQFKLNKQINRQIDKTQTDYKAYFTTEHTQALHLPFCNLNNIMSTQRHQTIYFCQILLHTDDNYQITLEWPFRAF